MDYPNPRPITFDQGYTPPSDKDWGCGCGSSIAERDCRPKVIRIKHNVTPTTAATCFPLSSCNLRSSQNCPPNVELFIRPRGTDTWILKYPAFDRDDEGRICFRWDDQLFNLGSDRLEAEFRECGEPCGVVELRIRKECVIDHRTSVSIEKRSYCDPAAAPSEITDVFNEIIGFRATLCAVLETSGNVLKLCGDTGRKLEAMTLCHSVELILDDGVNYEIIKFNGCTNGVPNIERGMGGTNPRRFPVGTTLRFGWTNGNAIAASREC